jgi:hypothetical protein
LRRARRRVKLERMGKHLARLVDLLTPKRRWGHFLLHSFAMTGSESERAYAEELYRRPKLSDDDFYDRFYAGSDVPKEIPRRLRALYEEIVGDDLSGLQPQDNHAAIYDGLDFADVLYRVEREFKLKIPHENVVKAPLTYKGKSSPEGEIDGSFDSVVRYLAKATRGRDVDRA